MKKILLSMFFTFGICFFVLPGAYASNSYCTKIENYSCVESYSSLDGFLNNLPGEFYPPLGFKVANGWIYFRDAYFDFYIPVYVIENLIPRSSSHFRVSDWVDYDKNRNKIHDDVDDVIRDITSIGKSYFGEDSKYKFRKWDGRITFVIGDWNLVKKECGKNASGCYKLSVLSLGKGIIVPLDLMLTDSYALKSVIAHEVFHAIQNVYVSDDPAFWSTDGYKNDNFFEGTAVLMQKNIVNWNKGYLSFLQYAPNLYPQYSIFTPTNTANISDYASFIWYNFLEEEFGKDFIPKLLSSYAKMSSSFVTYRSFLAVADVIESKGSTITDAFLKYVTWNYDYSKYSDGKYFQPTYITKSHNKFPTSLVSVSVDGAPRLYASNYIEFELGSGNKNLEVSFVGNLDADMYLTFLSSKNGRIDYKTVVNYPIGKGKSYSFTIPSYGNDTVVMIVSVLDINVSQQIGNLFTDYVYPYSYSAKKVNPIVIDEDATIGETDLKDYFVFDSGKTWQYKTTYADEIDVEIGEVFVKSVDCSLRSDCVTYDYGDYAKSFFPFGGNIYGFNKNGTAIPQIKHLTTDSFSSVLDKNQYSFFGYKESEDSFSQLSLACTPSLMNDYGFNGSIYSAVINDCALQTVDGVGRKGRFERKEYYVKGVGLVKYLEDGYYDDVFLYSYEESLVDTNLIDLANSVVIEEKLFDELENPFSDLLTNNKNKTAILYLKANGIINGYPDGTFKPENSVSRGELMKIIVEGKVGKPDATQYKNCFKDVKDEWFAPYVCYAKEQKWVDGYPNGTYKPVQTVNKIEAIKILLSSQGVDVTGEYSENPFDDVDVKAWFGPYIQKAKELGILEETEAVFFPSKGMTRAGICENLYRLLTK